MAYAKGTTVPVESSKAEIETLLRRNGAGQIASMWDSESHTGQVMCRLKGYNLRWQVAVPTDWKPQRKGDTGRLPDEQKGIVAEERRRWRVLLIVVKAKLEAVSDGLPIESQFLADLVLPGGKTVMDQLAEQVEEAVKTNKPITLMLGAGT